MQFCGEPKAVCWIAAQMVAVLTARTFAHHEFRMDGCATQWRTTKGQITESLRTIFSLGKVPEEMQMNNRIQ